MSSELKDEKSAKKNENEKGIAVWRVLSIVNETNGKKKGDREGEN